MTEPSAPGRARGAHRQDREVRSPRQTRRIYLLGYALALLLTAASFGVAGGGLWAPAIPIALSVLAIAQMGVHLVFFLHVTTAPDSTNNVLALAFGILIVGLVIVGSLWIMGHMNANMMPMDMASHGF